MRPVVCSSGVNACVSWPPLEPALGCVYRIPVVAARRRVGAPAAGRDTIQTTMQYSNRTHSTTNTNAKYTCDNTAARTGSAAPRPGAPLPLHIQLAAGGRATCAATHCISSARARTAAAAGRPRFARGRICKLLGRPTQPNGVRRQMYTTCRGHMRQLCIAKAHLASFSVDSRRSTVQGLFH